MRKLASIKDKIIPYILPAIIIIIWQFIVENGIIERYILPSPLDIIDTFFRIISDISGHMLISLKEALIGLVISVVFAIILTVLMDNINIIKKAVYPLLIVSQTVPIILLAPLFAIWFGFGQLPKVIVVVLVCFFPIVISLMQGVEAVDTDTINMLKSMGANRLQLFKILKFPASMVNFFSGLRIAGTYSIMAAVIGEWMGGDKGLGVYLIRVKNAFALDKVFAVILLIVILSMALFKLICLLQNIFMPWHKLKSPRLIVKNIWRY